MYVCIHVCNDNVASWTGGNYFSTYPSSLNGKITKQELSNIVDVLTDSVKPLITHVLTVYWVSTMLYLGKN